MRVFATDPDALCNTCSNAQANDGVFFCQKIGKKLFGRHKCGHYDGAEFPVDIVLITSTDLETKAVREYMNVDVDWESVNFEGLWRRAEVLNWRGERIRVLLVQSPIMGLPAAAVTATKAWYLHRPKYIFMVGVLAGNPKRTRIGDVIIPRIVYDYGAGKWDEEKFLPDPTPYPLDAEIAENCKELAEDEDFLSALRMNPLLMNSEAPRVITGGVSVSGASVISRKGIWEFICSQHREAISLDMESFAVVYSAAQIRGAYPFVLIAKSVCDYAVEKCDNGQSLAAYTSVKFAQEYIKRFVRPNADLPNADLAIAAKE